MSEFMCRWNRHIWTWQYVGNAWDPDMWVKVCAQCGVEGGATNDHA